MGLAPYGKPVYKKTILENILKLNSEGSYDLDLSYFKFHIDNKMSNKNKIYELLKVKPRKENEAIDQSQKDLASSIQSVLEVALENLINTILKITNSKNISLAGGVALNCSALGKLRNKFKDINFYVQPAAGDAGGSMGAALALFYEKSEIKKKVDHDFDVYCGPNIISDEAINFFKKRGCPYKYYSTNELVKFISDKLIEGNIIAICSGKSEWGPRALGARSIIANPMIKNIKNTLNIKIKQREDFRPFAPVISNENLANLFINPSNSEYMSFVYFLKEEYRKTNSFLKLNEIEIDSSLFQNIKSSIIHNDWSARIQTIRKEKKLLLNQILDSFFKNSGCPFLINTSFNTRGEPPVLNAIDAFRCFMRSEIDFLVINNFILDRKDQSMLTEDEFDIFEPD